MESTGKARVTIIFPLSRSVNLFTSLHGFERESLVYGNSLLKTKERRKDYLGHNRRMQLSFSPSSALIRKDYTGENNMVEAHH